MFGEAYIHDDVMVIPVMSVASGAGGGSGSEREHGLTAAAFFLSWMQRRRAKQ